MILLALLIGLLVSAAMIAFPLRPAEADAVGEDGRDGARGGGCGAEEEARSRSDVRADGEGAPPDASGGASGGLACTVTDADAHGDSGGVDIADRGPREGWVEGGPVPRSDCDDAPDGAVGGGSANGRGAAAIPSAAAGIPDRTAWRLEAGDGAADAPGNGVRAGDSDGMQCVADAPSAGALIRVDASLPSIGDFDPAEDRIEIEYSGMPEPNIRIVETEGGTDVLIDDKVVARLEGVPGLTPEHIRLVAA